MNKKEALKNMSKIIEGPVNIKFYKVYKGSFVPNEEVMSFYNCCLLNYDEFARVVLMDSNSRIFSILKEEFSCIEIERCEDK
jgi:hypothetical protein